MLVTERARERRTTPSPSGRVTVAIHSDTASRNWEVVSPGRSRKRRKQRRDNRKSRVKRVLSIPITAERAREG